MTSIHVFYGAQSAPMFRRMVDEFPFHHAGCSLDEDIGASGGWLVFAEPNPSAISTVIPRERRALCINEPSAMNALPLGFVNQFGLLISPYQIGGFRGRWYQTHTGLPWFFGAKLEHGKLLPTLSLQELRTFKLPQKNDTVSVVLSRKVFHAGHRKRLKLLELLKDQLGDRLMIYGRGIREIGDKAEAILPSKLHLALENTCERSYWTEKLADAFMGYALPVYGGCPDIHQWFPRDALLTIDPDQPEEATRIIREALEHDIYSHRLPAICAARSRILDQESAYCVIARAIASQRTEVPNLSRAEVILPPNRGSFVDRVCREGRRVFYQLTFRSRFRD